MRSTLDIIPEKPVVISELIANLNALHEKYPASKVQAETSKPFKLHVISEQWYLLTPEQLAVLEGRPLQIIEGPPGSGKSILLQHQAYNLVKNDYKICIIASHPMAAEYREFFYEKLQNTKESEIKRKMKIYDYSKFFTLWHVKRSELVATLAEFHLFFDDFFNDSIAIKPENVKELFETFLQNRNNDGTKHLYCWIACDSHQISAANNFREAQQDTIRWLISDQHFQHQVLRSVMRCASNIAKLFYKNWQPLLPESNDPICIGNNVVGKPVETWRIDRNQVTNRLIAWLKALKLHENYQPEEIAIIEICGSNSLLNQNDIEQIELETGFGTHLLRKTDERLPQCWNSTMKLDHSHMTYSLQWPCVFVFIDEATKEAEQAAVSQKEYVAQSRAMYKLHCITVRKPIEI